MNAYIWLDQHDREVVHIGTFWLKIKGKDTYNVRFSGHPDNLEIFGFEFDDYQKLTTEPREIDFTVGNGVKGFEWVE